MLEIECLNDDVLSEIFKYLFMKDIETLKLVNKFFNKKTKEKKLINNSLANSMMNILSNPCDVFLSCLKEKSIELVKKFIELGYREFDYSMKYCLEYYGFEKFKFFLNLHYTLNNKFISDEILRFIFDEFSSMKELNSFSIKILIEKEEKNKIIDELINLYGTSIVMYNIAKLTLKPFNKYHRSMLIHIIKKKTEKDEWDWNHIFNSFSFDTCVLIKLFEKKDFENKYIEKDITNL